MHAVLVALCLVLVSVDGFGKPIASTTVARARGGNKKIVIEKFQHAQAEITRQRYNVAEDLLRECLQLDEKDPHSWLALGRLKARMKDAEEARKVFMTATQMCPESVHLWQAWAVFEHKQGDIRRARELFGKGLALEPTNPYVCHAWGLLEQRMDEYDKARELLWTSWKDKPQAEVCVALAELECEAGRVDEARKLLSDGVSRIRRDQCRVFRAWANLERRFGEDTHRVQELLEQALTYDPDDVQVMIALAGLREDEGKLKEARDILRAAAQQSTKDGSAVVAYAAFEAKRANLTSAIQVLEEGVSRIRSDEKLTQALGSYYMKADRAEDARRLLRRSIRIKPNGPAYVSSIVLEYSHGVGQGPKKRQEAFRTAQELFQEGIKVDPLHGPLYNAFASICVSEGDLATAREIYERALRKKCSDPTSLYNGYGMLELHDTNIDRAREVFRMGIAELGNTASSNDAAFLYHSLGMLEMHTFNLSESLQILEEGLQVCPGNSRLLFARALIEIRRGDIDKARDYYKESIAADRYHPHPWQSWGILEGKLKNYQSARALFDCGLKYNPSFGLLYQSYATLEMDLGEYRRARTLFEAGLKRCPDDVSLLQSAACLEIHDGDIDRARSLIKTAIVKKPHHGLCWTVLAIIEEKSLIEGNRASMMEKVSTIYEHGLKRAPKEGLLYRAYGKFEMRYGRYIKARKIFEKGITVDPLCAELYHSLAELEALLGNVQGLADLHKKASEIFVEDIRKRGNTEFIRKIRNSGPDNLLHAISTYESSNEASKNVGDLMKDYRHCPHYRIS